MEDDHADRTHSSGPPKAKTLPTCRQLCKLAFLCRQRLTANNRAMSNQTDYGWKGGCVLKGLLFVMLFIILMIWVYYKNFQLTF